MPTVTDIPHSSEYRSGQVDALKLLKKTALHPNGRVQLDENGEIDSPKNPTNGTFTTSTVVDGKVYTSEIPRYTGSVTGDGVWRIALCQKTAYVGDKVIEGDCPQDLYHQMCEIYEENRAMGKNDDFRPELTKEETISYLKWKQANGLADEQDKVKMDKITGANRKKKSVNPA